MTPFPLHHTPRFRRHRALTLVEASLSILVVSVMVVAALNALGGVSLGKKKTADRQKGLLLAQDLMSEVLRQSYVDPDLGPGNRSSHQSIPPVPGSIGPDAGETARAAFDDVDDYDGWSASPPQYRSGTAVPDLSGWTRSVSVRWVNQVDLKLTEGSATGIKRITVTVKRDTVPVAELVALRTYGLPPPITTVNVLLVAVDKTALTPQETARKTLMESWGQVVFLIDASATQTEFDTQTASVDVAYVSEQIDPLQLGDKLRNTTIGVVNENAGLTDAFGFSSSQSFTTTDTINVVDNTHYITSLFPSGDLKLFLTAQPVYALTGFGAPSMVTLARTNTTGVIFYPSLATISPGGTLYSGNRGPGSGTALGRRVQLPWGDAGFDIGALKNDVQTIMKRAIEWAAGKEQ